jgi:outer membrane protein OmpA-like peptidoglycan-associated protein/tetratricopeptide (TPR) repeat protein
MFVLHASSLSAQMDVSISRKDFKTDKPGFDVAWKHVKDGDSYYNERGVWYAKALNEYTQAYAYNSTNAELNYKMGVSCLFSDKKDEAAEFFNKAIQFKSDVADDILLLSGRALQFDGKFQVAIDKFQSYLSSGSKKSDKNVALTNKYIGECDSALIISKDTLRIEIKNIGGNINSAADDYSEVITGNGRKLYFASRKALTPKASNYYKDTKFDENIFMSENVNGSWSTAMLAGNNLTTKFCETPLFINNAEDKLYIYAGYDGDGDIKVSEYKKGEWKTPEPEHFGINSSSTETSFCISPSGEEIAFVSNRRKNSLGGKDIYFARKINNRKWSKPFNAGPSVNSPFDEESVRFSRSGDTLWFSSAGHNTMGGFDIFYSTRNRTTGWSQAVNAGYPLNTPWDELFYVPSPVDDSSFFFVSNHSGGFGGLDIYTGKILPPLPPPPPPPPVIIPEKVVPEPVVPVPIVPAKPDTVIVRDTVVIIREIAPVVKPEPVKEFVLYLTGKVKDSESGDPVMARIDVIDLSSDVVIATTASSDVDGSYRAKLPAKKSYMIDFRATGFLSEMKRITIPETFSEEFFSLDVPLNKVKVGKKVVLNNILFELGKAILTTGSYSELDRLVTILQDNPQMKIEISGHTDNTGSPVLNAKLSTDRARAVVEYIAQKGIDRTRLTYRGFGSDQPIADNATSDGRSKNRRVEFKILEF